MSRASWKPLYVNNDFIAQKKNIKENDDIVVFNRATVLTKQMLGLKIQIYNGIRFYPLTVTADVLGHRVGEFAPTRKKPIPKKKKKK